MPYDVSDISKIFSLAGANKGIGGGMSGPMPQGINLAGAGSPNLGAGASGAASLGALAAGGGGTPWSVILPILWSLLSSSGIFGGSDPYDDLEENLLRSQQLQRRFGGYTPSKERVKGVDDATLYALFNQMSRGMNWGWPADKQIDLGPLQDIWSRLGMPGSESRIRRP